MAHGGERGRGGSLGGPLGSGKSPTTALSTHCLFLLSCVDHLPMICSKEATPTAVEGARQLFHSDVVRACLYLAETEFETLHDLDLPLCSRLQDRLVWYFGQRDGWVTKHHAGDIADACPRSEIFNCERVSRATRSSSQETSDWGRGANTHYA